MFVLVGGAGCAIPVLPHSLMLMMKKSQEFPFLSGGRNAKMDFHHLARPRNVSVDLNIMFCACECLCMVYPLESG